MEGTNENVLHTNRRSLINHTVFVIRTGRFRNAYCDTVCVHLQHLVASGVITYVTMPTRASLHGTIAAEDVPQGNSGLCTLTSQ